MFSHALQNLSRHHWLFESHCSRNVINYGNGWASFPQHLLFDAQNNKSLGVDKLLASLVDLCADDAAGGR